MGSPPGWIIIIKSRAKVFLQHYEFINSLWNGSHTAFHDGVIKWKHFPRYWPFVRGIHRSPAMRRFDVFFDLHLNKRFCKQSWGWWFETLSHPLWRHCNAIPPLFHPKLWRIIAKLFKTMESFLTGYGDSLFENIIFTRAFVVDWKSTTTKLDCDSFLYIMC